MYTWQAKSRLHTSTRPLRSNWTNWLKVGSGYKVVTFYSFIPFTLTGIPVSQLNFLFILTLKTLYSKINFAYPKLWKKKKATNGSEGVNVLHICIEINFQFRKESCTKLGMVSMEVTALTQSCVSPKIWSGEYGRCCTFVPLQHQIEVTYTTVFKWMFVLLLLHHIDACTTTVLSKPL